MVAAVDGKQATGVRIGALLDVFDPGAIYAQRDVVLSFTCYRAGMTADAFAVVDDEAVIHATSST